MKEIISDLTFWAVKAIVYDVYSTCYNFGSPLANPLPYARPNWPIGSGPVIKTYKIIKPSNLNCDSSETLFGLSSCFEELNLQEPPIEVIIEIEVQNDINFEKIYIKEQYWPPVSVINPGEDSSSIPTWIIIICIALSLAIIAILYSTFQNLRFKPPGLEP